MKRNKFTDVEAEVTNLNKRSLESLNKPKEAFKLLLSAENLLINPQTQVINKVKNGLKLLAMTYNNFGIYYKHTKKPNAALIYFQKALKFEVQTYSDSLAVAKTQLNICVIKSELRNFEEALNCAQQALNLLINNKNSQGEYLLATAETMCIAYYNIGAQYEFLSMYDKAYDEFKKGYEVAADRLGLKNVITTTLNTSMEELKEKAKKNND